MNSLQTRREFLKSVGLTMTTLVFPISCVKKKQRPNFIIFIGDDIGWNDIGVYGHPHIKTPNINQLASDGITFSNAFLTISSCSPSRSSIMTGRYPHATGAGELHQPLPDDQVVFAGILKDAGYYTASAGKWHLGESCKKHFDLVEQTGPSGAEKWLDVLQNRPKEKPFFLWFAAIDAHRAYQENTIPEPHKPEDVVVPPFLPDNEYTRKDLALYYDEISRMDDHIGNVLTELEHQGIAGNTFVVFMSDNGRPFPRCKTTLYDSGIKTPFILRWSRKVKPGTTCDELISSVDIAPTLLELAGVDQPETIQGTSFAPLLHKPDTPIRNYIYTEHNWHDYQAHERAVRSKQYLYIRNAFPELSGSPPADAVRSITYQQMIKLQLQGQLPPEQQGCFLTPRPAEELYDVIADPYQLTNLAADEKYADVLSTMRRALDVWIEKTDDKVPENPTPDKFDRLTGDKLST